MNVGGDEFPNGSMRGAGEQSEMGPTFGILRDEYLGFVKEEIDFNPWKLHLSATSAWM